MDQWMCAIKATDFHPANRVSNTAVTQMSHWQHLAKTASILQNIIHFIHKHL